MSKAAYTFQVLKYSPDPAAGEVLNIGVILCCPDALYLEVALDHKFERLSTAFSDFDGESYRYMVRRFESAVDRIKEEQSQTLFQRAQKDVNEISAEIWPDRDLGIKVGPGLAGVTDNPAQTLSQIFDRMVLSQYVTEEKAARSDEDVWTIYKKPLQRRQLTAHLIPKVISTPEFNIEFEHAFKNERWHVLQPVSFDLVKSDSIQRKAVQWLGNGTALEGQGELGTLFLLLGRPQQRSITPAYERARHLLGRIPIKHEIVEEDNAEDFAEMFDKFMHRH